MGKPRAKEHTVKVRITETEWKQWQRIAAEHGFSNVSEWLRVLVKKSNGGLDVAL